MRILDPFQGLAVYRTEQTSTENRFLLFAPATAVSGAAYGPLLERWAKRANLTIFAYDVAGIGRSQRAAPLDDTPDTALWNALVDQQVALYHHLAMLHPGVWEQGGHSMGGWLSLLSGPRTSPQRVTLLDPVFFPPLKALAWFFASFFHYRGRHPMAQKAVHRRQVLQNPEAIRRKPFFRGWGEREFDAYFHSTYRPEGKGYHLRHDTAWEARLFQGQPACAYQRLRTLPVSFRHQTPVDLVIGAESKTCDPHCEWWLRRLFPQLRVSRLPGLGHMFPMSGPETFLQQLSVEG